MVPCRCVQIKRYFSFDPYRDGEQGKNALELKDDTKQIEKKRLQVGEPSNLTEPHHQEHTRTLLQQGLLMLRSLHHLWSIES